MFFFNKEKIKQKEIQIEVLEKNLSQTQEELNYVKNILFSGIDDFLRRFYKEPSLEEKQKLEKEYNNTEPQRNDYIDKPEGRIHFQIDYSPSQNLSSKDENELSEILQKVDLVEENKVSTEEIVSFLEEGNLNN